MRLFCVVLICCTLLAQPANIRPRVPLVADGTTDNASALNAAMNAPTQIYIPCGTYAFSRLSVGSNNVMVVGQGTCTVLKALADSAALFNANGHTSVTVQNLRFDLSKAQKSTVNAGTATFTNVTITK